MASAFLKVSTYKVFLYGGPDGNGGASATVSLGVPDAYVALRFYPDGATVPPNSMSSHRGGDPMYYVNYAYDQLANMVDILRNEKPISFYWNDTTNSAYVTTANEPVGEGE